MVEEKVVAVINEMADVLNIAQLKRLQEVILKHFSNQAPEKEQITNEEYQSLFLEAKRVEGCSERTILYYKMTIEQLLKKISDPVRKITTERIRQYLSEYQQINNCGKVTIDNIRRNISSFFSWLEEEDYILKSPMRRIHKIKTRTVVKNIISDERLRFVGALLDLRA